jgi:hypothetical protein
VFWGRVGAIFGLSPRLGASEGALVKDRRPFDAFRAELVRCGAGARDGAPGEDRDDDRADGQAVQPSVAGFDRLKRR